MSDLIITHLLRAQTGDLKECHLFRCVTPCAAKTRAVRPVFGRLVGKLGAADPRICPKAMKANARPGHTLRLLDEARELGRHQHPGPENQDSQHMIDQPRGSFPDSCSGELDALVTYL